MKQQSLSYLILYFTGLQKENNNMMEYILLWIATLAIAFLAGKLMAKIKMPSILGWLIAGMLLGPHAIVSLAFGLIFTFQNIPV